MLSEPIQTLTCRLGNLDHNINKIVEAYVADPENKDGASLIHVSVKEFLAHVESILDYMAQEIVISLWIQIDQKKIYFPLKWDWDEKLRQHEKMDNLDISDFWTNNATQKKVLDSYNLAIETFEKMMQNRWKNSKWFLNKIRSNKSKGKDIYDFLESIQVFSEWKNHDYDDLYSAVYLGNTYKHRGFPEIVVRDWEISVDNWTKQIKHCMVCYGNAYIWLPGLLWYDWLKRIIDDITFIDTKLRLLLNNP